MIVDQNIIQRYWLNILFTNRKQANKTPDIQIDGIIGDLNKEEKYKYTNAKFYKGMRRNLIIQKDNLINLD